MKSKLFEFDTGLSNWQIYLQCFKCSIYHCEISTSEYQFNSWKCCSCQRHRL